MQVDLTCPLGISMSEVFVDRRKLKISDLLINVFVFFFFADFVIVYIKMIIDFKSFSFTFP